MLCVIAEDRSLNHYLLKIITHKAVHSQFLDLNDRFFRVKGF